MELWISKHGKKHGFKFRRRATGFHRQAILFELKFFRQKTYP